MDMYFGDLIKPLVAAAILAPSAASAVTVELTTVSGNFSNALWNYNAVLNSNNQWVQGPQNQSSPDAFVRNPGTDEIWWGNPRNGANYLATSLDPNLRNLQSGYTFEGIDSSNPFVSTDGSFTFGEFTHYNGVIWSNTAALASVDFNFYLEGTIDGQPIKIDTTFRIEHDETQNAAQVCAQGGGFPCQDALVLDGSGTFRSNVVTIGSTEYWLDVEGLVTGNPNDYVFGFFTPEGQKNVGHLLAEIGSRDLPPVPLPATAWMTIAGVGGLAVAARRRKRKTQQS